MFTTNALCRIFEIKGNVIFVSQVNIERLLLADTKY